MRQILLTRFNALKNRTLQMGGGKIPLLLCMIVYVLLFNPPSINAQQVVEGILYVNAKSDEPKPTDSRIVKSNTLFNIFQQYGVTSYTQTMPFAKTPSLHDVYTIEFSGNQAAFIDALRSSDTIRFSFIDQVYGSILDYQPADEFWETGKLWHLNKIQADSAWDITRSSDSIDIAILDIAEICINHPDINGKFNPAYDFYSHDNFISTWKDYMSDWAHGTVVSSFIAGETTETGGTPQGKLASIGFNSSMMFTSLGNMPQRMLFASTVKKAEVINVSSFNKGCHKFNIPDSLYDYYRDVFSEIFSNGTVVVASAGNGDVDCNGGPPGFVNGYIDNRIIQVSGTDSTDHFGVDDGNGGTTSFSHYSEVDLCAPGYNLYGPDWMFETVIDSLTGDTTFVERLWPYYGNFNGTSFSAPIVAGVAALIKSINPCLAPEDVQTILKSTTDPIVDANSYPGEIGTGRLNAYKAVKLAYESYRFQNYTIHAGEDITWSNPHFIDTLYIEPNGELTINANCFFNVLGIAMVDTAAKLTVNNVKLTTTCRNMWNGIEVWGNKNLSQYPYGSSPYVYAQGRLILNSATIENAHEAVRLWKPGDWNSTGGIVTANNTVFNNCRRSVEFMSYHNFHPYTMVEMDNMSKFEKCTFNMNEKYIEDTDFE